MPYADVFVMIFQFVLRIYTTVFLQACKLKLGDLKGALLDTDFAMRDGENNVKALFRQGQVSTIHQLYFECKEHRVLGINLPCFVCCFLDLVSLSKYCFGWVNLHLRIRTEIVVL